MAKQKRYKNQGTVIKTAVDRILKTGLKLDAIAEECGVSTKMLYMWMNGTSLPGRERAVDVASYLGIEQLKAIMPRGKQP